MAQWVAVEKEVLEAPSVALGCSHCKGFDVGEAGIDALGEDWTGTAAVAGSCRVPGALVFEKKN